MKVMEHVCSNNGCGFVVVNCNVHPPVKCPDCLGQKFSKRSDGTQATGVYTYHNRRNERKHVRGIRRPEQAVH